MGVSSDGVLFFGISYDENEDEIQFPSDWYEISKKLGCEISRQGSEDCEMFYLAATCITASRGYPEVLDLRALAEKSEEKMAAVLKRACEALDLPYKTPHWWLTSWWG